MPKVIRHGTWVAGILQDRTGLKNTAGDEQQEQQDCTGADKNELETAVAKVPGEAAWD